MLNTFAAGTHIHLSGFHPPTDVFQANDLAGSVGGAVAFFLVNSILVARGVAYVEGVRFWSYLRADLALQTSTVGILLGLGPIVVITAAFSMWALPLLGLPLLALHRAGRRAVDHQHDALHDALTGLPHRRLFGDRLEQAIALAHREERTVAVLLLDLDGFKDINDTLGHHEGDELLRGVATRLLGAVRGSDTVARLGGDEFAVVLRHVSGPDAAMDLGRDIARAVARPFRSSYGIEIDVRVSVGVALAPLDGDDAITLMRKADIAMYQAKTRRTGVERYSAADDDTAPDRLRMVAELRAATASGELVLHFQPKVSLVTGRVEAFEALIRWQHPRLGLILPGGFLDEAERSGLMEPLTTFAIDAALVACAGWRQAGHEVGVAVNLSPRALRDETIVGVVEAALGRHQVPAHLLQLELTEDSFIDESAAPEARRVMARLRELGVGLALDDFGKGYSSLARLSDLPFDELKIDRRFIAGLASGTPEAAIVRSTVTLAQELGLRVVAEGVETHEVLDELVDLGCDSVQGYLLGRPAAGDSVVPVIGGFAGRGSLVDASRLRGRSKRAA